MLWENTASDSDLIVGVYGLYEISTSVFPFFRSMLMEKVADGSGSLRPYLGYSWSKSVSNSSLSPCSSTGSSAVF